MVTNAIANVLAEPCARNTLPAIAWAKAKQFLQDGYLWSSGMFVFKASAFMARLAKYQPAADQQVRGLQTDNLVQQYAELSNLSMDYGLAETAKKVAVVPVDMAWSDLGSWDAIYQRHQKDSDNNVTHGKVFAQDTTNSLLWGQTSLLATAGLDNMVVIQTADATLICDRNRTEEIKTLVARVKAYKPELTEIHRTAYRPRGSYTVLEESANFKIKRIAVSLGAKLSMQMHKHRAEHWVVVSGEATITNNEIEYKLQENQSIYIPKTHRHRLANQSDKPFVIIEVQCGGYVGEDDIVRFEDTYGRAINT